MSNGKPRVLILEPHRDLVKLWSSILGNLVEMVFTSHTKEAEEIFKIENFDLVVVACVSGDVRSSVSLITLMRGSFFGPILANSSFEAVNNSLVEAGATRGCFKCAVPTQIRKILNL